MKIENPRKKNGTRDGGIRILATSIVSLALVLILLLTLAVLGLFWDDPSAPHGNPVFSVNTDGISNRPKPPVDETNDTNGSFELRCIDLEVHASSSSGGYGYATYTLRIYKRGKAKLRITDLSCSQYMGSRCINTVYLATEGDDKDDFWEYEVWDLDGELALQNTDSLMFVIKWEDAVGRTGGTYIVKNLEDYIAVGSTSLEKN